MPPKTKKRLCLVILLAVAAAAVLFLLFRPRTFPQVMGRDYDPSRMQEISVYLSSLDRQTPSREITLSPEDPAAKDLLALLESHAYPPVYEWGAAEGHGVALDYMVSLCMVFQREEDGYPAALLAFDGYPQIQISGPNTSMGTYKLSQAAQQELLDLLLKQPYEEQTQ